MSDCSSCDAKKIAQVLTLKTFSLIYFSRRSDLNFLTIPFRVWSKTEMLSIQKIQFVHRSRAWERWCSAHIMWRSFENKNIRSLSVVQHPSQYPHYAFLGVVLLKRKFFSHFPSCCAKERIFFRVVKNEEMFLACACIDNIIEAIMLCLKHYDYMLKKK